MEMARLRVPIVCVVIGEGGSGGALGIGVGDRIAHARARLLLGDLARGLRRHPLEERRAHAEAAAEILQLTAEDLTELGIIDEILPEPLGGAHRDHSRMAATVKEAVVRHIREVSALEPGERIRRRYEKFKAMGVYLEGDRVMEAPRPAAQVLPRPGGNGS